MSVCIIIITKADLLGSSSYSALRGHGQQREVLDVQRTGSRSEQLQTSGADIQYDFAPRQETRGECRIQE